MLIQQGFDVKAEVVQPIAASAPTPAATPAAQKSASASDTDTDAEDSIPVEKFNEFREEAADKIRRLEQELAALKKSKK